MITSDAASLGVSLATGLVKLTGRIDRVLAEKEAVTGPLALPTPPVSQLPLASRMRKELQALLDATAGRRPDPLGRKRGSVAAVVADTGAAAGDLAPFYRELFPDRVQPDLSPDAEFLQALRNARPGWSLDDPDARAAAFYLASEEDVREKGYTWRIALTVVDVLVELGAENTARFVRDERLRSVTAAVLANLAESDLDTADSWTLLLRKGVAATLNGALDARASLEGGDEWLDAVLGALAGARETSEAGDDYVLGLLGGKGYPLLVGKLLEVGGERLDPEDAGGFGSVAADFLEAAAPIVAGKPTFRGFFNDHWADLLGAAIDSLERHGPTLLAGESPLVRETLLALLSRLEQTPNQRILTRDTLVGLADAALAVVAGDPALITGGVEEPWLKELVGTVVRTVGDRGILRIVSRDTLLTIVGATLETAAANPELIVREPGLVRDLVGGTLRKVSDAGSAGAGELARAALSGVLETVAAHPGILDARYAALVVSLAGRSSDLLVSGAVTRREAAGLLRRAVERLVENPDLFVGDAKGLVEAVIGAVVDARAGSLREIVSGDTLPEVVSEVLAVMATRGRGLLVDRSVTELRTELRGVIEAGLRRTGKELGHRMRSAHVPGVLGGVVAAWARGEVASTDAEDSNFKRIFAVVADRIAA